MAISWPNRVLPVDGREVILCVVNVLTLGGYDVHSTGFKFVDAVSVSVDRLRIAELSHFERFGDRLQSWRGELSFDAKLPGMERPVVLPVSIALSQ
jgi:hypothetical protein